MSDYIFWGATGAVGLMVAALAFFIKRLISELEKKIEASERATRARIDGLEKRVEKLEERYDKFTGEIPLKYAMRDDLIRMTQNIQSRLDRITDILNNGRNREDEK